MLHEGGCWRGLLSTNREAKDDMLDRVLIAYDFSWSWLFKKRLGLLMDRGHKSSKICKYSKGEGSANGSNFAANIS